MELGTLAFPRKLSIKESDTIFLTHSAPPEMRWGVLNLGDGPFDGISTGRFAGSANGTYLAVNAQTGFTGDFISCQTNQSVPFRVNQVGSVFSLGSIWALNSPFLDSTFGSVMAGPSFFNGAGQFAGSSGGTLIAASAASGFSGNQIDCQVNGTSRFSVSATGLTTARGIGMPDDLLALDWMQVA